MNVSKVARISFPLLSEKLNLLLVLELMCSVSFGNQTSCAASECGLYEVWHCDRRVASSFYSEWMSTRTSVRMLQSNSGSSPM